MASRDELLWEIQGERHRELMDAVKGVHKRLDDINGRTRTNSEAIAVLEERSPGKIAAGVGAVVSGLIAGAAAWFK